MTLKPKTSATSSTRSAQRSGPWGRIGSASEPPEVVRFCQGTSARNQKTHSYPYRVLTAWHWQDGEEREELRIEAANDLITVHGKRLDRIVDALDTGTLEVLSEIPGDMPSENGEAIWVSRIRVEAVE